jgi:hypothetical protein
MDTGIYCAFDYSTEDEDSYSTRLYAFIKSDKGQMSQLDAIMANDEDVMNHHALYIRYLH